MKKTTSAGVSFTGYQVFMIVMLAMLQFTVILDFMIISPLGDLLSKELNINPAQFGIVVSAYALSAGASGLFAAGFADKFDRKKLLLFFYAGFVLGTALCALAPNYMFLFIARIVTGIFGGVLSSISMAIVTDLFTMQQRGRVMGFVQMAFGASQVLGIPIGLMLANNFGWHSTFWMVVIIGIVLAVTVAMYMKPIVEHLKIQHDRSPIAHLLKTVSHPPYLRAFLTTTLLATGGFMMMPFSAAFSVNNLGLTQQQLPQLYLISGLFTFVSGPLMGYLSDRVGKYTMFLVGTSISMIMVVIYTHLGVTPLWQVVLINVLMFTGIMGRIITSSALISAIPQPQDRGAFMSINSSAQQIAGGIAAAAAGLIVYQAHPHSRLEHFDTLGYIVIGSMVLVSIMMYFINKAVTAKAKGAKAAQGEKMAEAFVIE